ncbi:MAG: TM0106 family RecB-like putative nuclease [bacterium]|nr:TM0106 family RecB-like putative nuclease [bacterium]
MRRITGTHVYSYVKCPRLAALDLHLSRKERRPATEWEEFAAKRGRDFEDEYVAALGVPAPVYPERDFEAGAAATLAMLRDGDWMIHQGVLMVEDRLGLPDLLRKLPGESALGDHHYEVVDVKTSGHSRGDQILQVVFYTQLLAEVQERVPEYGALVLKDGREERFRIADYDAAAREVVSGLRALRDEMDGAQPFLQWGCSGCYHNHRCLPELDGRDDLSLVQGMSRGAQAILAELGCKTVEDLAVFQPTGQRQRGHLDSALVRRLRRAAQTRLLGKPVVEARPRGAALARGAIVHALADPFADRMLAFGLMRPASPDGEFRFVRVERAEDEWDAFQELVAGVPPRAPVMHFGAQLPRWYETQAFEREAGTAFEARFVDLRTRLNHAAIYPGPVFGLEDFVRLGLGRDPRRAGHAGAAAIWASLPDGIERMRAKLQADLEDLAQLRAELVEPPEGENLAVDAVIDVKGAEAQA